MSKTNGIEFTVDVYFPKDKFSEEVRQLVTIACQNIERETRHRITGMVFDLANKVSRNPEEN